MATTLLAALLAGSTGLALAKDGGEQNEHANIRALGTAVEMTISDSGKATVRGVKVTSVSGSTITASSVWGSAVLNWTVKTDGSTKFYFKNGAHSALADVKVGDILSFSGAVDQTASAFTVTADSVRDWSVTKSMTELLQKRLFEGKISSVSASTSVPASFVLHTNASGDFTVTVPAGISVLNNNWLVVPFSSFKVGDSVRVYGAVSVTTPTMITATVVRDTSI